MPVTPWDALVNDFPGRWRRWMEVPGEGRDMMPVEEMVEDGEILVRAELPGVVPEKDIDVSVRDSTLHISARREERTEKREGSTYRSEFRYGKFSRDIQLPRGVDRSAIKASYGDGILEVRIPRPSEAESAPKKVPVSRRREESSPAGTD